MIKINWEGFATTKGRQVYATTIGVGAFGNINYISGFLIGWDRWSDGNYSLVPNLFLDRDD